MRALTRARAWQASALALAVRALMLALVYVVSHGSLVTFVLKGVAYS